MSGEASNIAKYVALSLPLMLVPTNAKAEPFTAGTVMQKMGTEERYAFVAGMIEGFAIARYIQDGKKPEGMNCIYDWFYKNPKTVENIYTAFEHFPDFPPGSVVEALARKTCA